MITLKKSPGRDFTVLNLTDPQLGNGEWENGNNNCRFLKKTLAELVDRVHPELITISGDLSWAGHDDAYDDLARLLDSFGIPWAPVWGNHDNQNGPEYIDSLADRYLTHPLCLYEKGDPAIGNGNYVIAIEEDGRIASALIMLDSHDRYYYTDENGEQKRTWAKLTEPQLEWYRARISELSALGCNDTAIIMHIPFYAYRAASDAAYRPELDKKAMTLEQADGPSVWNNGYEDSVGVQYEGIGCCRFDDGAFEAVRELGSTKHVIVGHDHVNNWIISYEGVKLVYALKIGCGCYWDPRLNGGTTITVGSSGICGVKHEFVDISELM